MSQKQGHKSGLKGQALIHTQPL